MRNPLPARRSTLVRSVITSNGPRSDGVPEANATTLPVAASTNATSRDTSRAAEGARPQTIKATATSETAFGEVIGRPFKSEAASSVVLVLQSTSRCNATYRTSAFVMCNFFAAGSPGQPAYLDRDS